MASGGGWEGGRGKGKERQNFAAYKTSRIIKQHDYRMKNVFIRHNTVFVNKKK